MSESVQGSFSGLKSLALSVALGVGVIVAIRVTGDDQATSARGIGLSRVIEARGGPIFALGWSPDGSKLAASRDGTSVSILDVGSGDRRTLKLGSGVARVALGWSADGRSVMVWGLDNAAEFRPIDGSDSTEVDSPIGLDLLASAIGGGSVRLWGPEDRRSDRLGSVTARPHAMAFTPDGQTVAWGGADGIVRVCEVGTGREIWRAVTAVPKSRIQGIGAVAFSPDGSTVASAGVGPVRAWDTVSGAEVARMGLDSSGSTFVAFSPDGNRLAEASWDGSIRVWEPTTGRELARFAGQGCRVAALAWSPDGRTVAIGTFEGAVRLWEPSPSP